MGQDMTVSKYKPPKGEERKGGFGKVWKAIDKRNKTTYALKEMQKVKVIDKRSDKSIKYERELLSQMSHPFIVNMYYSFQDYDNLYLVMDLLTGGDLRYHVSRHRIFTEEQTKFFMVCIIIALEYIHSKNIIHRDIKPENLVLDEKGYVRITDFGIAKLFSNKNSNETSGTPGYMSPEVMKSQNHSFPVDYFALGVMAYEFMLGRRPYTGKSRKEIKEKMMGNQVYIKQTEIPHGWNHTSADFVNKLLIRKPDGRLGSKGIKELKEHPWLKNYDWNGVLNKTLIAPFIPAKRDNFDKRYCEGIEKIEYETNHRYEKIKNGPSFYNLFVNYTFYGIIDKDLPKSSANYTSNKNHHNPRKELLKSPTVNSYSDYSKAKRQMGSLSSSSLSLSGTYLVDKIKRAKSVNNKARKDDEPSYSKNALSFLLKKHNSLRNLRDDFNSKSPVHKNQYNIAKKRILNPPKSPITNMNKSKTLYRKHINRMSLSPLSMNSFENIKMNLSSSNLLKQSLSQNSKSPIQKGKQIDFTSNILRQINKQKEKPSYESIKIQRSKSNLSNIFTKKPTTSTLVISSEIINSKSTCHNSINNNTNISYRRKSSQNKIPTTTNSTFITKPPPETKVLKHSNSINFLFKNYKLNSHSNNSIGTSFNKTSLMNK